MALAGIAVAFTVADVVVAIDVIFAVAHVVGEELAFVVVCIIMCKLWLSCVEVAFLCCGSPEAVVCVVCFGWVVRRAWPEIIEFRDKVTFLFIRVPSSEGVGVAYGF